MEKVQTVIELSGELYLALSAFGLNKEKIACECRKLLALKYFQEKLLSLGKATELAGLSKWEFIEYLSDNNVPIINYDGDELFREFEMVEILTERLKS